MIHETRLILWSFSCRYGARVPPTNPMDWMVPGRESKVVLMRGKGHASMQSRAHKE